jgi:hypothetical protein
MCRWADLLVEFHVWSFSIAHAVNSHQPVTLLPFMRMRDILHYLNSIVCVSVIITCHAYFSVRWNRNTAAWDYSNTRIVHRLSAARAGCRYINSPVRGSANDSLSVVSCRYFNENVYLEELFGTCIVFFQRWMLGLVCVYANPPVYARHRLDSSSVFLHI